jgi:hypothetical protein
MKRVIFAGGIGSHLFPLTRVTNKYLLPAYDRPMVFHFIHALMNAEIWDILVVTGSQKAGDSLRLLGNGKDFGLRHINYSYQEGEGGIADALRWRSTLPMAGRYGLCSLTNPQQLMVARALSGAVVGILFAVSTNPWLLTIVGTGIPAFIVIADLRRQEIRSTLGALRTTLRRRGRLIPVAQAEGRSIFTASQ